MLGPLHSIFMSLRHPSEKILVARIRLGFVLTIGFFTCSGNASLPFSSEFWQDEVISACEFLEAGWFRAHSGNKVKGQELCLNPFVISRMYCGL